MIIQDEKHLPNCIIQCCAQDLVVDVNLVT